MKDNAPFLEMPNNMKPEKYPQTFVRAKNLDNYPCNYAAEKVPANDKAMKMSMGK